MTKLLVKIIAWSIVVWYFAKTRSYLFLCRLGDALTTCKINRVSAALEKDFKRKETLENRNRDFIDHYEKSIGNKSFNYEVSGNDGEVCIVKTFTSRQLEELDDKLKYKRTGDLNKALAKQDISAFIPTRRAGVPNFTKEHKPRKIAYNDPEDFKIRSFDKKDFETSPPDQVKRPTIINTV